VKLNHEAVASTAPILSGDAVDGNKQLMPHHAIELMEGSGLSLDYIKQAGIYSEWTPAKLGRILKIDERQAKRMVPAIVFPFTRADGSNGYSRCKPDRPRVDRAGKKVKYESPRGEPNEVYLPPGVAQYLSDPKQELLLTEGEKKSAAATEAGFPCIGLVGVYGWKHPKARAAARRTGECCLAGPSRGHRVRWGARR
jgi:putative DNA primase/helicase